MNVELRIALIILILMYLGFLIKSIKHKKIQVAFSTFWIITPIILTIAVAVPNLIEKISFKLGFETTSNMIFVVAIFVAFCLIFALTTKVSQEHKKNVLLVQEISLLKDRIKKIEKNREEQK